MDRRTSSSVVVPAHQAEETLGPCLEAIFAAGYAPDEVLVVDDGSRDGTGRIAAAAGVRVIRNETPQRPARARNIGVSQVETDVVFFVDADVTIHPGARMRLDAHFAEPSLTAVIGSYDDAPPGGGVASKYRNLLHFFTHQRSGGSVSTFWTGIGAVRRQAFLNLGGLESDWENIEDVEFGLRLSASGGRIELDPGLQGTHLKAWTPKSMFLTDLWGRAVPWTKLLLLGRAETGTLNTTPTHKASAAAVAFGGLCLIAAPLFPAALIGCAAALGLFLAVNAPFLSALSRIEGWRFVMRALPFHMLHYVAALAGFLHARFIDPPSRS